MAKQIKAVKDPELSVKILKSMPLEYQEGANKAVDQPPHVRAASSIAHFEEQIAIIQDDANFLALVDKDHYQVKSIPLPAGPEGARVFDWERGNQSDKLDLEACVSIPGSKGEELFSLGSGSDESREWVLKVGWGEGDDYDISLINAHPFYAYLRAQTDFCGSGLNVEGLLFDGDDKLKLFQRGNSPDKDGLGPVDATADVPWSELRKHLENPDEVPPPEITNIIQYELGELDGVRLTFSDAELVDGYTLFSASAEAPGDSDYIAGSALGLLDETSARWAEVIDEDGTAFEGKIEGLMNDPDDPLLVYFVIDDDQADKPSEMYEARLKGNWYN